MKEIFKDIPGYEGYYQVSNLGNVKSLTRTIIRKDGKKKTFKGKIHHKFIGKTGYYVTTLNKNGSNYKVKVCVLEAMAFLGHVPCGFKAVVDHIDNIQTNDFLENIQIITNRENCSKDIDKSKTTSKYIGVHFKKTTNKWVSTIRMGSKRKFLGTFNNEYKAHLAYQKALKEVQNENSI